MEEYEEEIIAEGIIPSQTPQISKIGAECSFVKKKEKILSECSEFIEQKWNFAGFLFFFYLVHRIFCCS